VTFPLAQSVGAAGLVVGLDPSTSMLRAALRKKHAVRNQIVPEFVRATGEFLPFRDSVFEYTTVGLAFRNFADKSSMLKEARRTLMRSGWFLSLDFVLPENNLIRRFYVFHIFSVLPALGRLVSHNWHRTLVYLAKSIQLSMSTMATRDLFLQHGFRRTSAETVTFGVVAILGAQK
jgi:demethylmenaquinone methyltransferase/2-methoxy-6-polyprenyl-1,4-benzoquinol methylase